MQNKNSDHAGVHHPDTVIGGLLASADPRALAVISRAIMALGTPVVALLVTQGAAISGGVVEPISFCNVLFVGNVCAALIVGSYYGFGRTYRELAGTMQHTKLRLLLLGASASALSASIFMALETTTVTNAVLLARLGPVFYAFAGVFLLAYPIRQAEWLGFAFIGVGVVATVFTGSELTLVKGDYLIILSSVFFATTLLLTKSLMNGVSLSAAVFARNIISAIVFFVIAIGLYGPMHFADLLKGHLWILMLIYALVIVVTSQVTWHAAISRLDPAAITRWTVLSPVFGITYAYFLNGETPTPTHIIALALVSIGILIASYRGSHERTPKSSSNAPECSLAAN